MAGLLRKYTIASLSSCSLRGSLKALLASILALSQWVQSDGARLLSVQCSWIASSMCIVIALWSTISLPMRNLVSVIKQCNWMS